ncbi:hypothetical protein SH449x_005030 [Pirellulaceae bacterium SH449]
MTEASPAWHSDENYRREHPIAWWLSLVVPLLMTFGVIVTLLLRGGLGGATHFFATCFIIVFVAGKAIITAGHLESASETIDFYSPNELFAMVIYIDFCTTLLVVYHLDVILRLPLLGWLFDRLVTATTKLLYRYPRLRKLTYIGIGLLVAMPFAGGLSGGVLGRLLGLERPSIFLSSMAGTLSGSLLVLFSSDLLARVIGPTNFLIGLLGICMLALFAGIARWGLRKWLVRSA